MDGNISGEESIDWDSEDEHEIDQHVGSFGESNQRLAEASTSSISGNFKLCHHFVGMGFPKKTVLKVIEENGTEDTESILEALLTYSALDDNSDREGANPDCSVKECEESFLEGLSDFYDSSGDEESPKHGTDDDDKLQLLASMGYTGEEACIAIERCGPSSSIAELTDFICAAQMARDEDAVIGEHRNLQKRKSLDNGLSKQRKQRQRHPNDCDAIALPNPMTGFGLPEDFSVTHRSLQEAAIGPPYFYYENVALAPKGVWDTISCYLYDVEPEFVDSKYFCAAARKRGYVHNLPIDGRYPLLPMPPSTIHEAFPLTRKWWPSWDSRTKLNCLQTVIGSARNADRIRKALEAWADLPEPPVNVQKYVLDECRKWNLVWVGRNKVAPLEPDEVEMLLGFPRNHTRGGGISRTDRYKSLGNSFQVDTVAFHLSVLKDLFPNGLTVLSLFSGIGGAEVALHRLGIPLKAVVSVEISEINRNIVRSWWEQTNQKGELIHVPDVQQLTSERIEKFFGTLGGFDLVVGGSPCNNLAGSNRVSRDGLEGKESSLFYEYHRILDCVKSLVGKEQR